MLVLSLWELSSVQYIALCLRSPMVCALPPWGLSSCHLLSFPTDLGLPCRELMLSADAGPSYFHAGDGNSEIARGDKAAS